MNNNNSDVTTETDSSTDSNLDNSQQVETNQTDQDQQDISRENIETDNHQEAEEDQNNESMDFGDHPRFKELINQKNDFKTKYEQSEEILGAIFEKFPDVRNALMNGQNNQQNVPQNGQNANANDPLNQILPKDFEFKSPDQYSDMRELANDMFKYIFQGLQGYQQYTTQQQQQIQETLQSELSTVENKIGDKQQFEDFKKWASIVSEKSNQYIPFTDLYDIYQQTNVSQQQTDNKTSQINEANKQASQRIAKTSKSGNKTSNVSLNDIRNHDMREIAERAMRG